MGRTITFPESDEDYERLPGYAEAIRRDDAVMLADIILSIVEDGAGGVTLNEFGKIRFAITIRRVGVRLGGEKEGLLSEVARHIKPFEGPDTGSIVLADHLPLKIAIRQFFAEVIRDRE